MCCITSQIKINDVWWLTGRFLWWGWFLISYDDMAYETISHLNCCKLKPTTTSINTFKLTVCHQLSTFSTSHMSSIFCGGEIDTAKVLRGKWQHPAQNNEHIFILVSCTFLALPFVCMFSLSAGIETMLEGQINSAW